MDTSSAQLMRFVNPLGHRAIVKSLEGKSIGFIDNQKPNAQQFLDAIEGFIRRDYAGVQIHRVRKNFSSCYLIANELEGKADAVVNAWGD
jgi:hypothetical protein